MASRIWRLLFTISCVEISRLLYLNWTHKGIFPLILATPSGKFFLVSLIVSTNVGHHFIIGKADSAYSLHLV